MSTLIQISELLGHHHHGQADARLILDFEARSKSRQRVELANGEAVALMLPRGTLLRGGDWLRDSQGRLIEVVAAPEWLSCVSGEPLQLLRAAYHLGNRHIPLQIAPGWLRYQQDSVLDQMVIGLGLTLDRQQLPFEPEAGAYQGVTTMPIELARLRLLQLTSPALPIGAFAYSQSLEGAVTLGWVSDADSLADWLDGLLSLGLGRLDLPILARQIRACAANQQAEALRWNRHLLASRESGELRLEDRQLGAALLRLLTTLEGEATLGWLTEEATRFGVAQITLFGWAAARFGIEPAAALEGFAFGWLENQLTAATKLMPLGQSRAQRLLSGFLPRLPALVEQALQCDDAAIGTALPGMAFASGRHESQYCRLFRS